MMQSPLATRLGTPNALLISTVGMVMGVINVALSTRRHSAPHHLITLGFEF
jgi:hypothetical protein